MARRGTARRGAVLICMCHAVSHTTVIAVIEAGARSVEEIAERSQAATRCGRCHDNLVMLLAAVAEQESET
ncbi:MAG: (2Fe-2S)-binding protein [Ilumatobacteraceae bacterium]